MSGETAAIDVFARRLRCVPRILLAQNARFGGPLDDHTLADLAQDVALVIWRKLSQYRALAPLEAWLCGICELEFMNSLRRRRRASSALSDRDPDTIVESVEESWADAERVHLALDRLGGADADVIRSRHFEGLTFDEIARRASSSINTIKTRYYRALTALERILLAHDNEMEED